MDYTSDKRFQVTTPVIVSCIHSSVLLFYYRRLLCWISLGFIFHLCPYPFYSFYSNCLAVFLITPLFPLLIKTQEVLFRQTFLRVNPRTLNYVKQNLHAFLQGEIMLCFISGFFPNRATKTSTQIVHKLNFVKANSVDCDSLWLWLHRVADFRTFVF